MKQNVMLHVPTAQELWFREKCMSDPKTMEYNAGYDVSYEGYHRDTGCIDFPEYKWQEWADTKLTNPNFFYAYILDQTTGDFVGYLNFNKNQETGKATMGIVIKSEFHGKGYMRPAMELMLEKAKEKGVKVLTDTVPETRERALKVFYDLGFEKVGEFMSKKFDQPEVVAEIERRI